MRALVVIAGLLLLLSLDALAEGRRDKLAVVDANDRQVGTVVGSRLDQVTIALGVNGRHALLEVVSAVPLLYPRAGAVLPIQGDGFLMFDGGDCSGTLFLRQPSNRLFDRAVVGPPGLTLYLPETPGAVPRTIPIGSFVDYFQGCQTSDPATGFELVPAVAIVDLLTIFTPPFRLVFRD